MIDTTAKYSVSATLVDNGIENPNKGSMNIYDSRDIASPDTNCTTVSSVDPSLDCIGFSP